MADTAWVEVLDTMYDEMMVLDISSAGDSPVEFDLPRHGGTDTVAIVAELTDFDEPTVAEELRALSAAGLVQAIGGRNAYGLTETGVKVAHERQQHRQHQGTQKILSYLTGVLAVSASGQFLIGVNQIRIPGAAMPWVVLGFVVILVGVVLGIRSRFTR